MNFLYGVLASLCASLIAWWVAQTRARGRLRALEGNWIEVIQDSERPLSLVRLRFHRFLGFTGHHVCEGENFHPDGRVYCKYRSASLLNDDHESKIFYIFRFDIIEEPGAETWGFGFLNIGRGADQKPTLVSGHYRSSEADAKPRGTKMKRLSDAAKEIDLDPHAIVSDEARAEFVKKYCSGWTVHYRSGKTKETRYCPTTRKDKVIVVELGVSSGSQKPFLYVEAA